MNSIRKKKGIFYSIQQTLLVYFVYTPLTFWSAFIPLFWLSTLLYTRPPGTNYIFDEQEALLANPYVNRLANLRFIDAIHRDFWGLPPNRSIGSYRPIPNFLWRLLWHLTKDPFFHQFYNIVFHAVTGAVLAWFIFRITRRTAVSYWAGFLFVSCAVLTEAVSGIVGIADVFGGLGAVLALASLALPAPIMPLGIFASISLSLFSKESGVVCVALIPWAALVLSKSLHPDRPARWARAFIAALASISAFVIYVELRKRWFPSPLPSELEEAPAIALSTAKQWMRDFLVWFHQAPLPKDPLNNPLANADTPHRIAGAFRVYFRGLTQVVFPKTLSGDYSFPQEPVPTSLTSVEIILGAFFMIWPILLAPVFWFASWRNESVHSPASTLTSKRHITFGIALLFTTGILMNAHRALFPILTCATPYLSPSFLLKAFHSAGQFHGWMTRIGTAPWLLPIAIAIGFWVEGIRKHQTQRDVSFIQTGSALTALALVWVVVSYFPHSNIPIVLPTVRAERFWYFPAIGTSILIALGMDFLLSKLQNNIPRRVLHGIIFLFFGFQCTKSFLHRLDYRDDLAFWESTKNAVPYSSKAHLNYSIMRGARGDLQTRLVESEIALKLAPNWTMAHIYTGDTLCRLHRVFDAWPYYRDGFHNGPNELSLIALALQCIYDEGKLADFDEELRQIANDHPDSWIAYLAVDTLDNAEKHHGVDPKYRPRGYNEGPKE